MAETYCGKGCDGCGYREELNCPGCRLGPGKPFGGDCDIAACCRTSGHKACDTCTLRGNCGKLMGRQKMAERRLRKRKEEAARKNRLAKEAPLLAKRLTGLLWIVVLSNILSLLSAEQLIELWPAVRIPGIIVNFACNAAYGILLMTLGNLTDRYRTAGLCMIVSAGLSLVSDLVLDSGLSSFFVIGAAVPGLIGLYQECLAHADKLDEIDEVMADKWRTLWYLHLGSTGGVLLGTFLTPLLWVLGFLLLIVGSITLIVVSILKIVYIYKTSQVYRNYPANEM